MRRRLIVIVSFAAAVFAVSLMLGQGSPCTPCPTCTVAGNGDVNGDGRLDIADPIRLLDYMFANGEPPVCFAQDCCDDVTKRLADLEQAMAKMTARTTALETELGNHRATLDDLEFGKKIAGVYCRAVGDLGDMYVFNTHGSCINVNSSQTTLKGESARHPDGYFVPGWYGKWTRTGERSVRADFLAVSKTPFPGGTFEHYSRSVYTDFVWNEDFSAARFEGSYVESYLPAGEDPTDCNAPWTVHQGFNFTSEWLRRLPSCN